MPTVTQRRRQSRIAARKFEKLIEEAEADVDAGRVEDFDKFIRRFKEAHSPLLRTKPRLYLTSSRVIQ